MPTDLYNGLVMPVVRNVSPDAGKSKVSMIVATPKPRLVTLAIHAPGARDVLLAGVPRKAMVYEIKIELGGIAGVIAPVIGKKPPNISLSVEAGEVPVFCASRGRYLKAARYLPFL